MTRFRPRRARRAWRPDPSWPVLATYQHVILRYGRSGIIIPQPASQLPDVPSLVETEFFQSRARRRAELGSDIVAAAYLRGDFVLSSGEPTEYYIDKYLFETKPTVLRRLASLLTDRIPMGVDRLAGPELGAAALAAAVSLESGIPFLIVRDLWPGGAAERAVAGECHAGEHILLIEDVVCTGARALAAADALRREGMEIDSVLAVIDREQGSADALNAAGLSLDALFTTAELAGERAW